MPRGEAGEERADTALVLRTVSVVGTGFRR
jgi:hypothetical protein